MSSYFTILALRFVPTLSIFISILFIFFLPGFLIWQILLIKSLRFKQYAENEFGFWTALSTQICISLLISGSIAFCLAETGHFSIPILLIIIASFCLASLIVTGRDIKNFFASKGYRKSDFQISSILQLLKNSRRRPLLQAAKSSFFNLKEIINSLFLKNEILYIPILIFISFIVFRPPMEPLWKGYKTGLEINAGISLAKTGGFKTIDPLLQSLSADEKEYLFSKKYEKNGDETMQRFDSAFNIPNRERNIVYPAFFHLYSAWHAIAYSILGLPRFLILTPVFGFLSAVIALLFFRSISTIKVAFLAAILLTFNHAQIYFARFSSSVIFSQLLIFTGIFFYLIFLKTNTKIFGILSGISFGQALLCGNDVSPYLIGATFLLICFSMNPERPKINILWIIIPAFLFIFQMLIFDLFFQTSYLSIIKKPFTQFFIPSSRSGQISRYFHLALLKFGIICAVVGVIHNILLILYKKNPPVKKFINSISQYRNGIILKSIGLATVAFFLSCYYLAHPPFLVNEGRIVHHQKWFYQYLDELGFAFLIVGIGFFVYYRFIKKRQQEIYFPFFIFFIFIFKNIWNTGTSSLLIWEFRTFIPIFLPFAYFLIAYSLFAIKEASKNLLLGKYLRYLIVIAALLLIVITAREMKIFKPKNSSSPIHTGILKNYKRLASILPRNPIIFFDRIFENSQMPISFTYLYNIDSVIISPEKIDHHRLEKTVLKLISKGKKVFFASSATNPESDFKFEKLKKGPHTEFRIHTPILEEKRDGRPKRSIMEPGTEMILYQVEAEL